MAIQNRELAAGTRLVARYKGAEYTAEVVELENGKVGFSMDGKTYRSPSAAGSAVMGGQAPDGARGQACNGWRFWSVAQGEAGAEGPTQKGGAKASSATRGRKKRPANKDRVIRRVDNQEGLSEGQVRWFCVDCMGGFVVDDGQEPEACPQGHKQEGLVAVEAVSAVES